MGLPLLTEKLRGKFWTTMTWAVYDGDVPNYAGSSFHFGVGERSLGGETSPLVVWRGTPTTFRGSTTEEYSGTHRWRDGLAREKTG